MKFLKALVAAAAPAAAAAVEPGSLINLVLGAVAKHVIPRKVLPNDIIPYLNVGLSSAVCIARAGMATGDWVAALLPGLQEGLQLAGVSTLVHQGMKIPLKSATGRSV